MLGQRRSQQMEDSELDYLVSLGSRIRELRQQKQLGLEELADRAGIHRTHLWKIEKGRLNAGVLSYLRLAHELELPVGSLFPEHKSL